MKKHSNEFKNAIKEINEIDSKIIYTIDGNENILTIDDLNSVTPTFQGNILKSVMKELDVDSNIDIPIGTEINYQFGVKVGNEFEYLNYGNYIVYNSEKQEDLNSYKITCYDKLLYSMKQNEDLGVTYPLTIREYTKALCDKIGLEFKNENDTFANYNRVVSQELFVGLEYTYRDILDQLAQVTASTICLDEDDKVEIRYINSTDDTIDEAYLNSVNVDFGQKYGPINSIVLSRSAGSDNVYKDDPVSVDENGRNEIKITDNQFMNWNDRADYLPDILNKLDGLEYYINDFSSFGIGYLDLCDRYNIKIGENNYSCILFNDEFNVTQGLEEVIHTDMPEETETDYTKADKTDRKINGVSLTVDKQQNEIKALAEKVQDISRNVTGSNEVVIENAVENIIYSVILSGNVDYPIVGGGTLGSAATKVSIAKTGASMVKKMAEYIKSLIVGTFKVNKPILYVYKDDEIYGKYELPIKHLYSLGTIRDELQIIAGQCTLVQKIGINNDGSKYILKNPITKDLGKLEIIIPDGDSTIKINDMYINVTYLIKNQYTDVFATKLYVNSSVTTTAEKTIIESNAYTDNETLKLQGQIDVSAGQVVLKADANGNIVKAELIANPKDGTAFNVKADNINFEGKNFNLTSDNMTINSTKFSVDKDGNATMGNANITGGSILLDAPSGDYAKIQVGKANSYSKLAPIYYNIYGNNKLRTQLAWNGIFLYDGFGKGETANLLSSVISFKVNEETQAYMNNDGIVGAYTYNNLSLASKKKNFEKLENALSIVKNIDIYKFNYKQEDDNAKKHMGFVIGEGFNYSHEITSVNKEGEETGADLYSMISLCLQAVKEQQEIIEQLQEKISNLELHLKNDKMKESDK